MRLFVCFVSLCLTLFCLTYTEGVQGLKSYHVLQDNVPVHSSESGTHHYKWRLTDWSLINNYESEKLDRNILFRVDTCRGSARLYVRALTLPFPNASFYTWKADEYPTATNGIQIRLLHADYFITVETDTAETEYSIVAITDIKSALLKPDDPNIQLNHIRAGFIEVGWKVTNVIGSKYKLFYREFPTNQTIMWTPCGILYYGTSPRETWFEVQVEDDRQQGDAVVVQEVSGLKLDTPYFFNIIAESPLGVQISYAGGIGVPRFERVLATKSDSTLEIVAAIMASVIFFLGCLWYCYTLQVHNAYRMHPTKYNMPEKQKFWERVQHRKERLRMRNSPRVIPEDS